MLQKAAYKNYYQLQTMRHVNMTVIMALNPTLLFPNISCEPMNGLNHLECQQCHGSEYSGEGGRAKTS